MEVTEVPEVPEVADEYVRVRERISAEISAFLPFGEAEALDFLLWREERCERGERDASAEAERETQCSER